MCELGTADVLGGMHSVLSVCSVDSEGGVCGYEWQSQASVGVSMEITNT